MSFLYSQLFVTPPKPTARVDGKTVIVTGSNVGLGKEAARHFASLGASTLIIAVRSLEKGNAAKADIESTTKISKDIIQVWQLDLSSYESVKEFAKRVEGLPRVDIVIENAAIATEEWRTAEDNEATITVNVVSTFLLALLILPKLKQTASKFNVRPMLTIVSSEVHGWAKFKERDAPEGKIFEQLNDKSKADMGDRYMVSKLLEVLAIRAIVERNPAESYPVTINTVNPGLCHSELGRDAGWGLWFFKLLLARTTEVGSRTLVQAGLAGSDTHGEYQSDCKSEPCIAWVRTPEGHKIQERVWAELVAKLEKIQPDVLKNL